MITVVLTRSQVDWLIKILRNYKKLRKSHFLEINGGLKREKVTNELVLVDDLITYFEEKLGGKA